MIKPNISAIAKASGTIDCRFGQAEAWSQVYNFCVQLGMNKVLKSNKKMLQNSELKDVVDSGIGNVFAFIQLLKEKAKV